MIRASPVPRPVVAGTNALGAIDLIDFTGMNISRPGRPELAAAALAFVMPDAI
jgi:hypothetical protein